MGGEAQAIFERSRATAEGIKLLSAAIANSQGGEKAAALRVAEQWVGSWKEMARQSNTIVVPSTPGDPAAMVSTAMGIFRQVNRGEPVASDTMAGLPVANDYTGTSFGTETPPPLSDHNSDIG